MSLLLAMAVSSCSFPAQALPLHRIAAGIHTHTMRVKTVPKELTASQAAAWIAAHARAMAQKTKTIGWCYKAVKGALKPFGIMLQGACAWMAKEQLENDERFTIAALEDLKPGDILVHDKSVEHPFGHIAIYLGKEEEASDHVQALITGEAYGGTTVFRLKSAITFASTVAVKQCGRNNKNGRTFT